MLNDRYRLIESIGEGGMATVYRALDTRLGRTVAIKILHPEFRRDRAFLQRFQQEAEFAASLGAHPNIVAIYDIGEDGDLDYIVMELIEGRSLKELIRERAPFSVSEAFDLGRQVASALDFAHKRGLVHRDVKPQNIVVTPDGTAKVTDFGIARSISASQLTRTGMVIGTAHYFSPEQAQGKPAGPPSDIYSLGIILYEMLTGHLPFDADTPIGVAMQHLHSDPPPPWDYNPQLPVRAAAVFMRALEKNPGRRYRDAGEFASALASYSGPETSATTTISPIVEPPRERTAIYRVTEPRTEPVRPVTRTRRAALPPERVVTAPGNPWRTTLIALGTLLLVLAVAAAAFFLAGQAMGGGHATPTPTATAIATKKPTRTPVPTATPKPHHRRTAVPTATFIPVIVRATDTPLPLPTWTPVPKPTSTPKPKPPAPTSTPLPPASPTPVQLTPTIVFLGPTPTETAAG